MGTASHDFVDTSLHQLIAAARLLASGICEIAVNAALAFIESAGPRNEIECALLIQVAAAHTAALNVAGRLGGGHGTDRSIAMKAAAAARLMRAYAAQADILRRLRRDGSEVVDGPKVQVDFVLTRRIT
jgi:hypothetical protein